ncbi:MAG: Rpn family recombination-promoting nuclease/putative transposase [Planctomycetales bacterium]
MAGNPIGIIPTVDFAFKLMLGHPERTQITVHFLNAILGDSVRITRATILNPILGKDFPDDKLSVLDILAEDEHGRKFNIEMQTSALAELPQRLAYYLSSLYSSQLTEGSAYLTLKPAISICVLTQSIFPDDPRLHLDFRLRDSSGLILTNDLQVHLLELQKLRLTEENIIDATPLERWAYFLLNADRFSLEDVVRIFPDREFAAAAGVLEMISKSPEEHRLYDMRLKFQRDEMSRREQAQREREELDRLREQTAREQEQAAREREQAAHEREQAAREREQAVREREEFQRDRDEFRREVEASRTKSLQDGRAEALDEGLREGERIGVHRGVLLGRIAVLQELLGTPLSTVEELAGLDNARLSELAEQLQKQLRERGSQG